jgi:hypothetical protein
VKAAWISIAGAAAMLLLGGCSGDAGGAQADIQSGEYSGSNAVGQQVVFTVTGDEVRVNGVKAELDDPSTNAAFTVTINGESDDYSCITTDDGKTIRCSVRRSHVASAQVPCANLHASPSPSASPSASATAHPSPSASSASGATVFSNTPGPLVPPGPSMCSVHPVASGTIALLRICTSTSC